MTASFAYVLYGLFALGGVGLYLAMPNPGRSHPRAGAAIGACAVIGFVVLLSGRYVADSSISFYFFLSAAVATFAAARVVTHPLPVYSAVYFALVILCVAVLMVMLQAEFLAAALVIIYAGAILVTYAFVIMLAQQSGARPADVRAREPMQAILVSFVLMGAVAGQIVDVPPRRNGDLVDRRLADASLPGAQTASPSSTGAAGSTAGLREGNTILVGRRMFGEYVVAVELAGVLLLVAMIGAIAMARKRVPTEEFGPPPPPIGRIGREVPPF